MFEITQERFGHGECVIKPRLGHVRVLDFDQGFKADKVGQEAVLLLLGQLEALGEGLERPRINPKVAGA